VSTVLFNTSALFLRCKGFSQRHLFALVILELIDSDIVVFLADEEFLPI